MTAARRSWLAFLARITVWVLACGAGLHAVPVRSEIPAIGSSFRDAAAVLEQGIKLEQEQRWVDALAIYEDAVRHLPPSADVEQHRVLAHIHCDLSRRLDDPSFLQLVTSMSQQQAMAVYDELALKVRSHYFDNPDWQRLTWRGTANLDIAITDNDFRQKFLPNATDSQVTEFRQFLRRDVNQRPVRTQEEAHQLVGYTVEQARQQLQLSPACSLMEYCCGGIASLDHYSSYLTETQLDDVYSQIEGNFVGLGIELKSEDKSLRIVKVIPSGPAERAGIRAGERILAVNGIATSAVSPEEAADLLKGEEGTYVRLTLQQPELTSRDVRVVRQRVDVPSVEETRMLDRASGTGYFKVSSFQKTTSREVDNALWQLHREGMQVLIIDLRGNPGGLLTSAVEIADKFLTDGIIVSTRGRSDREDFDYRAHQPGTWRVPLVVLIDHDTASASEIFAGAIRDQGRGTVVGERSYGKGSVQGIFPLTAVHSGVRLTTAKFFSPSGQAISDRGIMPHRTVQVTARPDAAGTGAALDVRDPMIEAAFETARQIALAARPQQ